MPLSAAADVPIYAHAAGLPRLLSETATDSVQTEDQQDLIFERRRGSGTKSLFFLYDE